MWGVVDLPTYLAGVAVIVLLPGPNSLYVVSVAARRGVRAGYRAAAGVFCGDTVLMTLSAAGVASLLKSAPLLFAVVRFAGAGYLCWLAVGMLRSAVALHREYTAARRSGESLPAAREQNAPEAVERPWRRAFVISLLNPKAILFFLAFFLQFVDPDYGLPALSFLVLGAFAQLASLLYLSALIFGGTRLADLFRRRRRLGAGANSLAGALFLGFAVKLSLSGL